MAKPVRVELTVGHLHSYLVGILGASRQTAVVLEGEPRELRQFFRLGLDAVDRAELEAAKRRTAIP